MEVFTRFDASIMMSIMLIALLIVIYRNQELYSLKSRFFRLTVYATILMLLGEIMSWMFEGVNSSFAYHMNIIFNTMFFMFSTLVVSLWACYIDAILHNNAERLKKRLYYLAPTILLVIVGFINLFVPIVFEISRDNVYTRLPMIWIGFGSSMVIYAFILVGTLVHREHINQNVIVIVLAFLLLPLAAAILQMSNLGLILMWPATAIALIFAYLIFETTSSSIDYLTGLNTRVRAEEYIISQISKKIPFATILIDLDNFKPINDQYGHQKGDQILVEFGNILKQVFTENCIISRYGGDEFIIVVSFAREGHIRLFKEKLKELMQNSPNTIVNTLQFSMGTSYCFDFDRQFDEYITEADDNMYLDKAVNKNFKRRRSDS